VAQGVGAVISFIVLVKKFNYKPKIQISKKTIKNVWKYSGGNYLADAFNFLPTSVLPIIIVNRLGADKSAYYFIVMMIVGLLYVIPNSVTRSLFSEGSFDKNSISKNIKKTMRHIALMLIPAIIVLLISGKFLLAVFGKNYSSEGIIFLYIMTLFSILLSISSLYASLFRLTNNIKALIVRNAVYSLGIIVMTYAMLPHGLVGVGLAYILSGIFTITISYLMYDKNKKYE
jgi:O-antigen/teichoic acid export membrane protein